MQLEPIEQAVTLAAHCAKVLAGAVPNQATSNTSIVLKCLDDITNLFQGPVDPKELKLQFDQQMQIQIQNPDSKTAKLTKMILSKAVDRVNALNEGPKEYTINEFRSLVIEMINEEVKNHMVNELERLHLKELGGVIGTQETDATNPTSGTTGTSNTSGGMGTRGTNAGNGDAANNVMVPGTSMNVNQGLAAASKDPNFKRKANLIKKISDQIQGMKGVVVK